MTIRQQGGIFGRNPTFNNVDVEGTLMVDGSEIPNPVDILTSSDIGVTVQGYDVNTAKINVAQTFTQVQNITTTDATQLTLKRTGSAGQLSAIVFKDGGDAQNRIYSSGSEIVFGYGLTNTEGARFTSSGFAFPSGNGIDFSATSGTGTSELFDDYEEGTFTPTVEGATTAGSGTYANQLGYYTKVGRLVTFQIWLQVSTHTGTGTTKIMGMPYATSGTDAATGGAHVAYCANLTLSSSHVVQCAMGSNGNSYLVLQQYPLTGTATSLGVPVDGNMQVRLVGSYISA